MSTALCSRLRRPVCDTRLHAHKKLAALSFRMGIANSCFDARGYIVAPEWPRQCDHSDHCKYRSVVEAWAICAHAAGDKIIIPPPP